MKLPVLTAMDLPVLLKPITNSRAPDQRDTRLQFRWISETIALRRRGSTPFRRARYDLIKSPRGGADRDPDSRSGKLEGAAADLTSAATTLPLAFNDGLGEMIYFGSLPRHPLTRS